MRTKMVSVIIPNYNHFKFLNERVRTVLNQSFNQIEIIILDDFSSDNSKDVIEELEGESKIAHVVFNTKNSGSPFKQWAKGIELAKGDLIWIAESDDVADSVFLEKIVPYFDDPEVVLVFTDCKIIGEKSELVRESNPWIHDPSLNIGTQKKIWKGQEFLENYQRYRNFISNASSAVFRKKAIDDIILSKIEEFRYSGDWLFWNFLAFKGNIVFIEESLCSWRSHDASTRSIIDLSKDINRLNEASLVIYETNQMLEKKPLLSNYSWVLDWWLSRYSYRNLWNRKYIVPSLPFRSLYFLFYWKLLSRTIKEVLFSVIRKLT
jgi:glycosyltransferase involved in cell wall biosynthesis